MQLGPIAKTVVAVLGAIASALTLYIADDQLTTQELIAVGLAAVTAAGVYKVENKPAE